jgi:nitroreductase
MSGDIYGGMDIEQLLTTTRSARKTLDLEAPIDLDEVKECLRIGVQAPNGSNNQSWKWMLVADPERRRQIAELYRDARIEMTGREDISEWIDDSTDTGRVLSSAEWLVQHLADVPLFVIPCFEGYMSRKRGSDAFHQATIYGSIFPAVWNFQLALHTKGYGTCLTTLHLNSEAKVREILGIPDTYVQGCLLPVARLKPGTHFKPAPRKPLEEVIAVDSWE